MWQKIKSTFAKINRKLFIRCRTNYYLKKADKVPLTAQDFQEITGLRPGPGGYYTKHYPAKKQGKRP